MDLDPLLIGYKEPVPILNIFARDYGTGDISGADSTCREALGNVFRRSAEIIAETVSGGGVHIPMAATGGS